MSKLRALAIDGPAGAGKSTIAKAVSKKLGWPYLDTGALFRAIGLFFLKQGTSKDDEEAVRAGIGQLDVTVAWNADGSQKTFLSGEDVSGQIRTTEVGQAASDFARYPAVRDKILSLEREIAAAQPVVMDGRDIGTVVLPDAETKVYLTASVRVRAMRRLKDYEAAGAVKTLEEVEAEVAKRDYQDMNRPVAPLKQAEDAVLVDSSEMTLAETEDTILSLAKRNAGC